MKNEAMQQITSWLSMWSDDDLSALLRLVDKEVAERERQRELARGQWIAEQLKLYKASRAQFQRVGNTIIVAVPCADKLRMAQTIPSSKDELELGTGIAVAYAKAVGTRIPDFI
jgi:hypothetical protein